MLVKLSQSEIQCKPIALQTAQGMIGFEVLILHVSQLCLQPSEVFSGLPNFTPISVKLG